MVLSAGAAILTEMRGRRGKDIKSSLSRGEEINEKEKRVQREKDRGDYINPLNFYNYVAPTPYPPAGPFQVRHKLVKVSLLGRSPNLVPIALRWSFSR